MMIYPEAGAIHADYSDGSHVIHYVSATVTAGRAVTFASAVVPGAPSFRLSYQLAAPDRLAVTFAMAPPGSNTFRSVAVGMLQRAP